jgi:hypothetical protein
MVWRKKVLHHLMSMIQSQLSLKGAARATDHDIGFCILPV